MRISNINYNYPIFKGRVNQVPSKPANFNHNEIDLLRQHNDLRVFKHHIYEYKKGMRNLVLTTEKAIYKPEIEARLQRENIPYVIRKVGEKNINVFFGNEDCIKIVSTFDSRLNLLSPEKDFMLGIMLGYSGPVQYGRYIKRNSEAFKN